MAVRCGGACIKAVCCGSFIAAPGASRYDGGSGAPCLTERRPVASSVGVAGDIGARPRPWTVHVWCIDPMLLAPAIVLPPD